MGWTCKIGLSIRFIFFCLYFIDSGHAWYAYAIAINELRVQLAIKCGHLEMVKKLLPQCKLNHLDNNMNSIFHYAAPTTKEIINVSSFWFSLFQDSKIA